MSFPRNHRSKPITSCRPCAATCSPNSAATTRRVWSSNAPRRLLAMSASANCCSSGPQRATANRRSRNNAHLDFRSPRPFERLLMFLRDVYKFANSQQGLIGDRPFDRLVVPGPRQNEFGGGKQTVVLP